LFINKYDLKRSEDMFFKIGSFLVLSLYSVISLAQPVCTEADLTKNQVEDIIKNERLNRTDLPGAFSEYTSSVHRQGCHYVYIEFAIPAKPGNSIVFKLNQKGNIVDAVHGW